MISPLNMAQIMPTNTLAIAQENARDIEIASAQQILARSSGNLLSTEQLKIKRLLVSGISTSPQNRLLTMTPTPIQIVRKTVFDVNEISNTNAFRFLFQK